MSIRLSCGHCKKVLQVRDEHVGKRVKCPGCANILLVPNVPQAATPTAKPAAPGSPSAPPSKPATASPVTKEPRQAGQTPPTKPPNATKPANKPNPASAARQVQAAAKPAARQPAKGGDTGTRNPAKSAVKPVPPSTKGKAVAPAESKDGSPKRPGVARKGASTSDADLAAELFESPATPKAERKQEKPKPPEDRIVFNCFYCDEQISFPVSEGGKQAPCPQCRRIIKIPKPVKEEPKDWRQPLGPSLAKQTAQPQIEGAWGSIETTTVSRETLIETEAAPEYRDEWTLRDWLVRVGGGLAVVLLLVWGVLAILDFRTQQKQASALELALRYVDAKSETKLPPILAAEVYFGAGLLALREQDAEGSRSHFRSARAQAAAVADNLVQRDAFLAELALAQIDLGSADREQVINGNRLDWNVTQEEIRQSLNLIKRPQRRLWTTLDVCRRLYQKDQPARAEALARLLRPGQEEEADYLAIVGLASVNEDDRQRFADLAHKSYLATRKIRAKPPAMLIALWHFLGVPKKAVEIAPYPRQGSNPSAEARLGYAFGHALRGEWPQARQVALLQPAYPPHQLEAIVAVARVAANEPEVLRDLLEGTAALAESILIRRQPVAPSALTDLIALGSRTELSEEMLSLAERFPPPLKSRARFEHYRSMLRSRENPDYELMQTEAEKGDQADAILLALFARHNARFGSDSTVLGQIRTWEPEHLKPLGYIGVALGIQER